MGFFVEVARTVSAPCWAHTEMMSRQLEGAATRGERLGLWLHFRVCPACRLFKKQLRTMLSLHARATAPDAGGRTPIPAEVRARLESRLAAFADQSGNSL